MDATLPFRWRRSPSHGKCSRRFCGSLRNYGRSHHQHQRETLDGHALKSNRREECVVMPAKMSRSAPTTTVPVARGVDSRPHLASVLQEGRKSTNIHAGSGVIWGIPAYASTKPGPLSSKVQTIRRAGSPRF